MDRVLPVPKQPHMHTRKQPHAFGLNGSKALKPTELTNITYTEQNKSFLFKTFFLFNNLELKKDL